MPSPRSFPISALLVAALLAPPGQRLALAMSDSLPSPPATLVDDTADSTTLDRRVAQVAALVSGKAVEPTELFAPSFLAAVPPERMRLIVQQLLSQLGPVTSTGVTERTSEFAGKWRFTHEKGYATPVTISIEPAAPHRVVGLVFAPPTRLAGSLDDIAAELRTLPGQVSFLVARVDDAPGASPVALAQLEPARSLAIGSAFKLWILAALVRDIEAGQRRWEDVVRLDSARRSLPSGVLHSWPHGTPMTVQALASLMISQSDNTATDELLHLVGREKVEAMLRTTGHSTPERNVPFLSTRELFAFKSPAGRPLATRYLDGDVGARRAVLAEIARLPQASIVPDIATPGAIDRLEWFASSEDLAGVMTWLRDHTTSAKAAPARALLAINPGLGIDRRAWPYAGFKGGSEPGVLDLTLLLRDAEGRWVVCTATWNDSAKDVDTTRLAALVQRAIELAAQ